MKKLLLIIGILLAAWTVYGQEQVIIEQSTETMDTTQFSKVVGYL